jgi:hypothetical protein
MALRKPIFSSNISANESIFETGLTCLSGTYIELIDEKTRVENSHATVPLKNIHSKLLKMISKVKYGHIDSVLFSVRIPTGPAGEGLTKYFS